MKGAVLRSHFGSSFAQGVHASGAGPGLQP
jgi:hypothetical protein